jgi:hypothetical protein
MITYVAETRSCHKIATLHKFVQRRIIFSFIMYSVSTAANHTLQKVPSICNLFVLPRFLYLTSPCITFFCLNIFPHSLLMFYLNRKTYCCFSSTSTFTQTFIPHFPVSGPPKNIGCPTRYRTRHFFNNSNTNEDIATKYEQGYVRCVRNEEECVCSAPNCCDMVKLLKKYRVW